MSLQNYGLCIHQNVLHYFSKLQSFLRSNSLTTSNPLHFRIVGNLAFNVTFILITFNLKINWSTLTLCLNCRKYNLRLNFLIKPYHKSKAEFTADYRHLNPVLKVIQVKFLHMNTREPLLHVFTFDNKWPTIFYSPKHNKIKSSL